MIIGRSAKEKKRLDKISKYVDGILNHTKHLSHSSFSRFLVSPAHFIEYKFGERKTSDAFETGKLVDTLLLERDKFEERYLVFNRNDILPFPEKNYKLKANREARDKFLEDAPKGVSVVEQQDIDEAEEIVNALLKVESAKGILDLCDTYQEKLEFVWNGVKWLGYKDASCTELTVDLKTAKDASKWGFRRSIKTYGYHRQGALYNIGDGDLYKPYFNFVVEKTKPYGAGIHHLTRQTLLTGKNQLEKGLESFRECLIDESKFLQSYEFWAKKTHGVFEVMI